MGIALGLLVAFVAVAAYLARRASQRGSGLRTAYREALDDAIAGARARPGVITGADLARLPPIVAEYLRRMGVPGRPRVRAYHATFRAAMRGGPDQPWMPARAEQHGFFDPPVRLFFMRARRGPVPVDVFHRYDERGATMRAKVLGLFPVLDVDGPELTQSETVTFLNDMFLLAPAALVDAPIEWSMVASHAVRATLSMAGHTVSAIARFDERGDLIDFESEDRYRIDRGARLQHWSTPVLEYGESSGTRVFARAEARWTEPSGDAWPYARFELESIRYEPGPDA